MTLQRTAWTRRRALLALAAGGAADGWPRASRWW